jgi:ligand-binding sensor domain-containing protein
MDSRGRSSHQHPAPPAGGLWIGFRFGGAAFLHNGHLTTYADNEGLTTGIAGGTHGFAQDSSGTLWAATSAGLMRLDGCRWHRVGAERHFSKTIAWQVFVDREGTLWVTSNDTISYLLRGAPFFEDIDLRGFYPFLAQSPDGSLWLADTNSGVRPFNPRLPAVSGRTDPWIIHARAKAVLVDPDGSICSATYKGVSRVAVPATTAGTPAAASIPAETFEADRGLSSDRVLSILEDREGNIWFGTFGGLDRWRGSTAADSTPSSPPAANS